MVDSTSRRRFLGLAAAGATLSIAGCDALEPGEDNTTTTGPAGNATKNGTATGTRTVTVRVQPNRTKLQKQQLQIQAKLRSGNLSRQQAQQQMQQVRQRLLAESMQSFQQKAANESSLTVEDSIDQYGVFLVSGQAGTVVDSLDYDEVSSLYAEKTFEQAKAQSSGSTTTPTG
ncbi:MAG: hypothetical protein ABEI77_09625 [Halorientalis sp.]